METNKSNIPGGKAIEVDYETIIHNLTSLFTVVMPSHESFLEMSDHIHAPISECSSSQTQLKLDREVSESLSQDIEKTKNNSRQVNSIVQQFLNFAESGKSSMTGKPVVMSGDTAKIAAVSPVLNTLIKLEWLACICQENSIALDNLSTVLENGQHIWNLFPAAIYSSLDCLIQLSILWRLFGAYINVQAFASGKTDDTLVDHGNPQVVQAKIEISSMLEMRKEIMGSQNTSPVPVTEILLDIIIPVMKVMDQVTRPMSK